jgi:hypothetical protein
MRNSAVICGILGALLLAAVPAKADAIDGEWCAPGGTRRLSIDGPKLVTPAGARIEGNYTRHSFAYKAPAGEVEAGNEIEMRLMGEHAMLFRPQGAANAQTWTRCSRPIS